MSAPIACVHCRRVEPSAWLLGTNHGWRPDHCLAMHLRRNHLIAVTRGATEPEQIEEYVDRAIEVWRDRLDPELVAAAHARVAAMRTVATPPDHQQAAASEEVALW